MPNATSTIRLTVKSTVMPLPNVGFYFDAECEGKSVMCMNAPTFQGQWPSLKIDDEIIAQTARPAFASNYVLYLTKVVRCPGI